MLTGAYGIFVLIYRAILTIRYPYGVNLGEPALSQAIRFFSEGKNPYHDLSYPPFSLVPYGPVYICLTAFLRHWLPAPFVGGRAVCFLSTVCAAVLIYLILRKNNLRRGLAIVPVFIFLSHPYIVRWGVQVNVDMMGVCLSLAAFYFLWLSVLEEGNSKKYLILGIFFSSIAFFTKSSMMACPAAFFWSLIVQKRFKKAFLFFLFLAICVGLTYTSLNGWTHGGYFYHTTYEISKRSFYPIFIYQSWISAIKLSPLLFGISLAGLGGIVKDGARRFLYLYLFFVLLLTLSLGKQGSDTNYFLEWCAVSSLVLGIVLDKLLSNGTQNKKSIIKTTGEVLTSLILIGQIGFWTYPYHDLKKVANGYKISQEFFDHISLLIKKTPGKMLIQDMSLLTANDKEIFYEPFPMAQMSYSGVWDPKPILDDLDQKNISLVILFFYTPVLRAERSFTPAFMKMFNARYQLIGHATPPADGNRELTGHTLYFYRPKKD